MENIQDMKEETEENKVSGGDVTEEKEQKQNDLMAEIYSYAKLVLICSVIALFIRFVTPLILVDGSSMNNTLYDKGLCIGCTFLTPQRGQIITFKNKTLTLNKTYIKRVVGVPGDTIRITDHVIYVNGTKLEEDYAWFGDPEGDPRYYRDVEEFTLGDGEYYACGDNRFNSRDCRIFGPITKKDIQAVGVVHFDTRWIVEPVRELIDNIKK